MQKFMHYTIVHALNNMDSIRIYIPYILITDACTDFTTLKPSIKEVVFSLNGNSDKDSPGPASRRGQAAL
jgi:hypothetical protein